MEADRGPLKGHIGGHLGEQLGETKAIFGCGGRLAKTIVNLDTVQSPPWADLGAVL